MSDFRNDPNFKQIDFLINEYLTDGVISSRERDAILNMAEKNGFDKESIDLYIDAQIQKHDKKIASSSAKIHTANKCPYCGQNLPPLTDKCPYCDSYISPETNNELNQIIDDLEEALVKLKSTEDVKRSLAEVERYTRKAKLYYSNNPKVKILLEEIDREVPIAKMKAKQTAFIQLVKNNPKISYLLILILLTVIFSYIDTEIAIGIGLVGGILWLVYAFKDL